MQMLMRRIGGLQRGSLRSGHKWVLSRISCSIKKPTEGGREKGNGGGGAAQRRVKKAIWDRSVARCWFGGSRRWFGCHRSLPTCFSLSKGCDHELCSVLAMPELCIFTQSQTQNYIAGSPNACLREKWKIKHAFFVHETNDQEGPERDPYRTKFPVSLFSTLGRSRHWWNPSHTRRLRKKFATPSLDLLPLFSTVP